MLLRPRRSTRRRWRGWEDKPANDPPCHLLPVILASLQPLGAAGPNRQANDQPGHDGVTRGKGSREHVGRSLPGPARLAVPLQQHQASPGAAQKRPHSRGAESCAVTSAPLSPGVPPPTGADLLRQGADVVVPLSDKRAETSGGVGLLGEVTGGGCGSIAATGRW